MTVSQLVDSGSDVQDSGAILLTQVSDSTRFISLTYPQVKVLTIMLSTLVSVLDLSRFDPLHRLFLAATSEVSFHTTLPVHVPLTATQVDDLQEASQRFARYISASGVPSLVFAPTHASILLHLRASAPNPVSFNDLTATAPTHSTQHSPFLPDTDSPDMLAAFVSECPSAKHFPIYLRHLTENITRQFTELSSLDSLNDPFPPVPTLSP